MESTDERIILLEKKITLLENHLNLLTSFINSSAPKPSSSHLQNHPDNNIQEKPSSKKLPQAQINSSGNFLGIVGVLCFVFAAIYIIKLALDSGWLSPIRQIILAAGFGTCLIGAGFWFKDKDKEYVSYLPAAGVIVLFLTVFGATNIHFLFSFHTGCTLALAVAVICLLLYEHFHFSIYKIIATVGAFLLPSFMSGNNNLLFTNTYFVIASLTFSAMAVWLDSRAITLISAYLAITMTSLSGNNWSDFDLKASFVFIHFCIYVCGILIHSFITKKNLTKKEALSFLPLLIFFYAIEYVFIDKLYPKLAPYLSLGYSLFLIFIYFFTKFVLNKKSTLASGELLFSAALVGLVHSCYFVIPSEEMRPLLLLIFIPLIFSILKKFEHELDFFPRFSKIILFCLFVWNYFSIAFEQLENPTKLWLFYGMLYSTLIFVVYIWRKNIFSHKLNDTKFILLAGHILATQSIYNLVKDFGSLSVSLAWLIYALGVLSIGYKIRDTIFAKSSLVVLLLSAVKVLIWDMSQASSITRIGCLILTGGLLYYSGLIFRRVDSWREKQN